MPTETIQQSSNFTIFKQMIKTRWHFAAMTVAKVAIIYIVALAIVGPHQASLIFISILFSATADIIGGWRMGLACIPTFAITAFVALIAGSNALTGAIWVGLMAAILGVAAVRGYHHALIGLPMISSVIVTQPAYLSEATEVAIAVAVGAALGLLVRVIPPRISLPASPRLTTEGAALYGVILFAFVFATVYLTVAFNLPHGFWLTVTVLAVIQPDVAQTRNRVADRISRNNTWGNYSGNSGGFCEKPSCTYCLNPAHHDSACEHTGRPLSLYFGSNYRINNLNISGNNRGVISCYLPDRVYDSSWIRRGCFCLSDRPITAPN
jgi:hypothetical protein